jgi:tetratricopeptide (TPR) repeat protein
MLPLVLLILFLLAIAVLSVEGLCRNAFLYQWLSLAQATKAMRFVAKKPKQAEALARRVKERLERLSIGASRYRGPQVVAPGTSGSEAYSIALVVLAILAQRANRHEEATGLLNIVRRRATDLAEARGWLMPYYMTQEVASDEAIACYAEAIHSPNSDLTAEDRARALQILRRFCRAHAGMTGAELQARIGWCRTVQQVLPQADWPQLYLAEAYFEGRAYPAALTLMERMVKQGLHSTDVRILTARTHAAMGQRGVAVEELLRLAAEANGDVALRAKVAALLFRLGRRTEAANLLASLPATQGTVAPEVNAALGQAALIQGKLDDALVYLEKAHKATQGDAETALLLAEACRRQGNHDRAASVLRTASGQQSTNPQLHFALGSACFNAGRYPDATIWLSRCINAAYRAREAAMLKVIALVRGERFDDAAIAAALVPSGEPEEEANLSFYHGVANYGAGKPGLALPHFMRAYKLGGKTDQKSLVARAKHNVVGCYWAIAEENVRQGNFAQAAATYSKLQSLMREDHPQYFDNLHNLCESHLRTSTSVLEVRDDGELPQATEAASKAVAVWDLLSEKDPRSAARHERATRALWLRGVLAGAMARQKRYSEALAVYQQCLERAPTSEFAGYGRALCTLKSGRAADGLRQLEALIDAGGGSALRAALAVAESKAEGNDYASSAQLLQKALARTNAATDANYSEACCRVVTYSVRAGNVDEARQLAKKYLAATQGEKAETIVAALLVKEQDFDRALEFLEKATFTPAETHALALLLAVYRRVGGQRAASGKFNEAGEIFRRANQRLTDGALARLCRLTELAIRGNQTGIDDTVLGFLEELLAIQGEADAALVRTACVAYQQRAHELASKNQYRDAPRLVSRSAWLWQASMRGQAKFWQEYIDQFNVGKQHPLQAAPEELETDIARVMADVCISFVALALTGARQGDTLAPGHQSQFNVAEQMWSYACNFASAGVARELFFKALDVPKIINNMDLSKDVLPALSLLQWVYRRVEAKKEFDDLLLNLTMMHAFLSISRRKVDDFLGTLNELSKLNGVSSDQLSAIRNIKSLQRGVVNSVTNLVLNDPAAPLKLAKMPLSVGGLIFGILNQLALLSGKIPGGLTTAQLDTIKAQLKADISKALAGLQ